MSAVLEPAAYPRYPAAMSHQLRSIRRRNCVLALARGLLWSVAVLAATMVIAMALDRSLTLFSTTIRVSLTTASLTAAIMTFVGAGVLRARDALRLRRAAHAADEVVPQLEERWTTVAHLVESHYQPRTGLERAMLQQVTSEAVAMVRLVQPAKIAPPRQLRSSAAAFLVASLMWIAFLAADWQQHRILLRRFWSPMSNISATRLESVTGNVLLPKGEPANLVFRSAGLPRAAAVLEIAVDGLDVEAISLRADSGQPEQFTYEIASLESSFRYRARAGDGQTEWYSIAAVDRPTLSQVKFSVTAPAYVERPRYEKDYLPDRVQAVQGSRLRVQMRPHPELRQFKLLTSVPQQTADATDGQSSSPEDELVLKPGPDGWYLYETTLEQDLVLTPVLLSRHGLTNRDLQKCILRVIPDRAPVARVITPTDEMAVSPDEVIEIEFEAHDDHGIAKAELVVYEESGVEGEPPSILQTEEILLGEQAGERHVRATTQLDLSKFAVREGANLSFAIRVADNRAGASDPIGELQPKDALSTPGSAEGTPSPEATALPKQRVATTSTNGETTAEATAIADRNTMPVDRTAVDAAMPADPASVSHDSERSEEPLSAEVMPSPEAARDAPTAQVDNAAEDGAGQEPASSGHPAQALKRSEDTGTPEPASASSSGERPVPEQSLEQESPGSAKPDGSSPDSALDTSPDSIRQETASDSDAPSPRSAEKQSNGKDPANDHAPPTAAPSSSDPSVAEPATSSDTAGAPPAEAAQTSTQEAQPDLSTQTSRNQNSSDSVNTPPRSPSSVSGDLTSIGRPAAMTDDLPRQYSESNRLRLKIEKKEISAAESAPNVDTVRMTIRERLEQIDRELKPCEEFLSNLAAQLSPSGLADPQIHELTEHDQRLEKVERVVADLRNETKETPYAFVGLQMVEIGSTHITPARDRLFAVIRQPDVDAQRNVAEAFHRVSRARELLAELLVRYERVLREEKLADSIEETAKVYEVYVENLHRFLLAQIRPNPNPLQRRMAVVEVDQDYLDRLRQVTEMRRDLMAEFARMLGDDPRLLSRYIDLLKRRQTSLRERLAELHQRQELLGTELSGWLRVDETQRADIWLIAAETRLQELTRVATQASQLEERAASQFPLGLDQEHPTTQAVLDGIRRVAIQIRSAGTKARRLARDPFDPTIDLAADVETTVALLGELEAALQQLSSEQADNDGVVEYSDRRLAEVRALSEKVLGLAELAAKIEAQHFPGVAKVDQQQLARNTELLRVDMQAIDLQLQTEFRGEVPDSVTKLAEQLKQVMESVVFTQVAATFDLQTDRLAAAEQQQTAALQGFQRAAELFDEIRLKIVEELDQVDPQDPNIADLVDPTLDEILEQLEREPDLNALLGIPNRPQNLRVISDFVVSQDGDGRVPSALEQAASEARRRAKQEEEAARKTPRDRDEDPDMSEEQWQQFADAEKAQQNLEQQIEKLKRQAEDPKIDPEEADKLRRMAQQLEQFKQQLAQRDVDDAQWDAMVRSDQMQALLRAAAKGEPLPDQYWNRLMSSLDDGLWQVRRRTPPEEFRRAIEQYQERIRRLTNVRGTDAD